MCVARFDACRAEEPKIGSVRQEVDGVAAREVATLDQHGPGTAAMQRFGSRSHGVLVLGDREVGEARGFRQVRRDDGRQRQQMLAQSLHDVGVTEAIAARRHQDRVEHHRNPGMEGEPRRHDTGDLARRQHADLHGRDVDVGEDGVDLGREERGRGHVDGRDAAGVLGRQRGQGRHAVAAERREGLEVGLDAGAAARVGACNGKDVGGHGRFR